MTRTISYKRRRARRPSRTARSLRFLIVAGAVAARAGYASVNGGVGGASNAPAPESFSGRVTHIVDGDTFWISSRDRRIRVWGLDAPETHEAGGAEATAELTSLIADRELTCRQRDIDRYGRIVGQCFLPDGRDITAAMIASGTAQEYCSFSGNHYRTC